MNTQQLFAIPVLCLLGMPPAGHAEGGAPGDGGPAPIIDAANAAQVRAAPVQVLDPAIPCAEFELPPTALPASRAESPCDEVGSIRPAPAGLNQSMRNAAWHELPDGSRVARVEMFSPGAVGLRLEVDPGALEVRVYDPVTFVAHGPYTGTRLSQAGTVWTTVIFGEAIGVEYRTAPGTPVPDVLPPIATVTYFYVDTLTDRGFPPAGTCDPDINCSGSWANTVEDLAVGIMFFNCTPESCGQCTGALLNRAPTDVGTGSVSPIFMTARHCIGNQSAADSLIVIWDFKTASCNGATPDINSLPRNDGSLLLKTTFASEWSLLGLFQPDRGNNYLGWDANFLDNGSSVTGVHHGAGQPKRICFGTKTGQTSCLGADHEWAVAYSTGRTIPGASGSPVFDSSRRVRGTLSCDNRDCPPTATSTYGRLDTAFAILGSYIFEMANPNHADRGAAGDPGNDGDTERGTSANPFDTVYESTFAVPTNGEVRIAPGSYNEQFRLWRPMTLTRSGGSGVVRIGD